MSTDDERDLATTLVTDWVNDGTRFVAYISKKRRKLLAVRIALAISAARERGAREEREACAAIVFPRHAEPAKGQYELRRDLAAAIRARADK